MSEHTPTPWTTDAIPSAAECKKRGDWIMLNSHDWFYALARVNAFHSPDGRKIATEDISEGLVWQMWDALETIATLSPGGPHVSAEVGFKATFLVLCQARDTAIALLSSLKVQGPET